MQRKKLEKHWFKHDISASSDSKIAEVEMKHGLKGYAIYFKIIEQLYLNEGKMEYNNVKIAWRLRAPNDKETLQMISSIVEDFGLFKFDQSNLLYSPRALDGLNEILTKSKIATQNINKRYNKNDAPNKKNEKPSDNSDLSF